MALSNIFSNTFRESKYAVLILLWFSSINSTTLGYDSSMMAGLNILPSYTDYFHLTNTTLALQSAVSWAGCAVAGIMYGTITDALGRKKAMWLSAIITLIGVLVQSAAQNIAMFVVGRFVVGLGNGAVFICGPIYLAETLPLKWRGRGLGLFMDFFYVGGLLAAGITYGTAKIQSTWAWRLPSIVQGLLTIVSVIVIPLLPESPRWLIYRDRQEEALEVIALTHSNCVLDDPDVLIIQQEIIETLHREAQLKENTYLEIISSSQNLKKLMLCASVAIITMCSGNNIISYYLGIMLDNAGITNSTTQLEINIILNAWCLVCAVCGTLLLDNIGRKPPAVWSCLAMTVFIFLVGALTKVYGTSENNSGIYSTVAGIFLFQGAYSFAWTPLAELYPPEVLHYTIRSTGMGFYTFLTNGLGLMVTMAFPYALDTIGWKTYMINGGWDVLQLLFVQFFWVETKGKTLEELDGIFDDSLRIDGVTEGLRADTKQNVSQTIAAKSDV